MSKAIYKPKGKAGEYAEWACNLYVGCSNDCSYCYCKRGVLAHAMGGPVPKLKSCFRDEDHALEVFIKELEANLAELQKSSLFFTFSSDPMIPETRELNWDCIVQSVIHGVRVQVLTKNADFIHDPRIGISGFGPFGGVKWAKIFDMIAWGFTLTGHDELEPGASSTGERIEAMRMLHNAGYRTFASLEPVVDPVATLDVFRQIEDCCDLLKVGLMSGVSLSTYNEDHVKRMTSVIQYRGSNVYLKKSLTDYLGIPAQEPIDIFKI